jgi:hypothetical protein
MSSNLRSTSVPVGYFVMSAATFNASVSGDEIFEMNTSGEFVYDGDFFTDLSNGAILTFEDYGVTEYNADVTLGNASTAKVDLRKVVLVSVAGGSIDVADYAGVDGARYVPLGTLRNTSTPFDNSTVPSSVQLIGKFF